MKKKLLELGMSPQEISLVQQLQQTMKADECWQKVSTEILTPQHDFEIHKAIFTAIYPNWQQQTVPVWTPTQKLILTTNISKCMKALNMKSYDDFYNWSISHYQDFLKMMIGQLNIKFDQPMQAIMDCSNDVESPHWFPGVKLNIANSCFNASAQQIAIIYKNFRGITEEITYHALEKMVNRCANGLQKNNINAGDAVAIVGQMRPEIIISYLGIIKAGAIVVSIPDSFSSQEIQKRFVIGNVKAVFTHDQIVWGKSKYNLYEKVVNAEAPFTIIIPYENTITDTLRKTDKLWNDFLNQNDLYIAKSCDSGAYTNILFSSGTTGAPKGIPWNHTTPIKCAFDAFLHHNIQPGDILAWPTNLGWMMGPWLVYAALINQGTIAICEGSPIEKSFAEFIETAKVTMLGLVPSIVKAWRNSKCLEGLNLSHIKVFSSSGEPSFQEDMLYLMSRAGYKPIIEYCGGTEIGGAYITNTLLKPQALSRFNTPALGSAFILIDNDGKPTDCGEVALIPPAVGLSTELINKEHHETYFADMPLSPSGKILRRHGDFLSVDENGYYRMLGRSDDTMKLNGIKISAVEIETILIEIEELAEVAAIAVTPETGGPSQLIIYTVIKSEKSVDIDTLKTQMQKLINDKLNPFFRIHQVKLIDGLPRTDSNKIQRRRLRDHYLESATG